VRSRLLLDLNVVLDVLFDRKPHVAAAAAIWSGIERGRAVGFLPAHSFTTIHYLAERARGRRFARQTVVDLLTVFRVAAVNEQVVRRAVDLEWPDFEDAVSASCALVAKCHAIVTRDPKGFAGATPPVLDPAAALSLLKNSRDG
jgi:predicted nucleic acid-binding protein